MKPNYVSPLPSETSKTIQKLSLLNDRQEPAYESRNLVPKLLTLYNLLKTFYVL